MFQTAFITGATAGIGKACAEFLASKKMNLIITGRREQRLNDLKVKLEGQYQVNVTPLAYDITNASAIQALIQEHSKLFNNLDVLINNAGCAQGVDPMPKANIQDWDQMIDINVKGLLYTTRACLPYLEKQNSAHIINIGSVAGRWVYPGGAVYCATKHAVRAISEGLRMDLIGKSIRVSNICPGLVETEFSEVRLKDKQQAKQVYQGMRPLEGKDIAECVWWALQRPSHVNIQEMIVYPTDQASIYHVHRTGE